jgi:hypothetical protein
MYLYACISVPDELNFDRLALVFAWSPCFRMLLLVYVISQTNMLALSTGREMSSME